MRYYVKYLLNMGEKLCIIENDFGAINVDMVLLKNLEELGCNLEMVVGGDGAVAHKRRLKTKLISMAMMGFTRVIIEPSGIYDVDEFFDLLYEEPIDGWYEAGNVIAIVNPKLEKNLSAISGYFFMSEIAQAGAVVFSRTQECTPQEIEDIQQRIRDLMEEFGCNRKLDDKLLVDKEWDKLNEQSYSAIVKCGFNRCDHVKISISGEDDYQTFFYFDFKMDMEQLVEITRKIFEDKSCDGIHRIKGIVQTNTGDFYELNTTRNEIMTNKVNGFRAVLIVIGEDIPREKLVEYLGEPTM
ncbi:MAG: GTPase (G3E family) [Butyrivibrio sp.]|nr:GTPase (G3E family) [Butyrivibrio sp.]